MLASLKRLPYAVKTGGSEAGRMVRWYAAIAGVPGRLAADHRQPRWESLEHDRGARASHPRGFLGSRQASQPASRYTAPDRLAFDRPIAGAVEVGEATPCLQQVRQSADGLELHWHGDETSFFHYEWLHR